MNFNRLILLTNLKILYMIVLIFCLWYLIPMSVFTLNLAIFRRKVGTMANGSLTLIVKSGKRRHKLIAFLWAHPEERIFRIFLVISHRGLEHDRLLHGIAASGWYYSRQAIVIPLLLSSFLTQDNVSTSSAYWSNFLKRNIALLLRALHMAYRVII